MQAIKRIAAVGLALSLFGAPAIAQTLAVVVNGTPVSFDQPPVVRAGRAFVPLRGVFQQLGASVVYANGVINAQGNGRSVHLTIGSTQASVNGTPVAMDVAPFLIGARTLVPLRFVAQALGATVNWNQSNNTVYIQGQGGGGGGSPPATGFGFVTHSPYPVAFTVSPPIRATFNQPVNRDSLQVSIDGNNVTQYVYANPNGFDVTPNFALNPGNHTVTVTGTTQAGQPFSRSWAFTTRSGGGTNYIQNVGPSTGTTVGSSFRFSGYTLPGSRVHIVAQASQSTFGGLLQIGTGTYQTDVIANGNGYFTAQISVNESSGGPVRVIATSVSPSGYSVEQIYNYTGA